MKILKFGGSSVSNSERINEVISILKDYHNRNISFAVVFSAFGGVTNDLIKLAESAKNNDKEFHSLFQNIRLRHFKTIDELFDENELKFVKNRVSELLEELNQFSLGINLLGDLSKRTLDAVMSFGEQLSCTIIAEAMNKNGIPSEYVFSGKLIRTNDEFGNAKVDFNVTNEKIKEHFSSVSKVQVVTGFIGSTEDGKITTLGRGGSDYTAAILGAALDAEEIEIWTDVNGIMTADPRKVKNSIPLKAVTYNEAMELSHFGAKVIHPPTMQPAMEKKIKIRIRNTFNPKFKGTVILDKEPEVKFNAKGISSIDNISLLRIEGSGLISDRNASSRIFDTLSKENIPLLFITQGSSGYSICLGVLPKFGHKAKRAIEEELKLEQLEGLIKDLVLEENLSLIAVVGEDMRATPGISGTIFNSLGKNGINIKAIAQGSSELNVSCVVRNEELRKALNVIHNAMFLSKSKVVNLFMAGPGLVGSALLDYFNKKLEFLNSTLSTKFRLVGLINSKKMLFDLNGIEFSDWSNSLNSKGKTSDPEEFVKEMIKMDLANSIFIDSTASDLFVNHYIDILEESISIVTPNKIANTKEYDFYKSLRKVSIGHHTQFKYSTNVGAALPVISTISQLVNSGETIHKIEAILSGSLSYIFNSFDGSKKFSDIVLTAKENGFTEPDPRDDLSGLDVARKLLILLREAGLAYELSDIQIENLVPEFLREIDVKEFLERLPECDEQFDRLLKEAENKNAKLKYVASFDGNKAIIGLKEISNDHPFYNLQGSENIISIHSDNHSDFPLVLKGKGAGAEYTAFGIFSDIIEITKFLG